MHRAPLKGLPCLPLTNTLRRGPRHPPLSREGNPALETRNDSRHGWEAPGLGLEPRRAQGCWSSQGLDCCSRVVWTLPSGVGYHSGNRIRGPMVGCGSQGQSQYCPLSPESHSQPPPRGCGACCQKEGASLTGRQRACSWSLSSKSWSFSSSPLCLEVTVTPHPKTDPNPCSPSQHPGTHHLTPTPFPQKAPLRISQSSLNSTCPSEPSPACLSWNMNRHDLCQGPPALEVTVTAARQPFPG